MRASGKQQRHASGHMQKNTTSENNTTGGNNPSPVQSCARWLVAWVTRDRWGKERPVWTAWRRVPFVATLQRPSGKCTWLFLDAQHHSPDWFVIEKSRPGSSRGNSTLLCLVTATHQRVATTEQLLVSAPTAFWRNQSN